VALVGARRRWLGRGRGKGKAVVVEEGLDSELSESESELIREVNEGDNKEGGE
jgi:hypothetical protein